MTMIPPRQGDRIRNEPLAELVRQFNGFNDNGAYDPRGPKRPLGLNDTGRDLRFGDVAAIDLDDSTPDFDNPLVMISTGAIIRLREPTEDDFGNFVIIGEKIPQNQTGEIFSGEFALARLQESAGSADEYDFADVDVVGSGSIGYVLKMQANGNARVLKIYGATAESGSAAPEVWAFIRFQAGVVGSDLDPDTIGSTGETEAAQSDSWDRENQAEGKSGVIIAMQTRTAYNDSGDEKLYAYYRDLTYDSGGLLVSVSAETRITIDVPEACP